jgi:hypothetical protein
MGYCLSLNFHRLVCVEHVAHKRSPHCSGIGLWQFGVLECGGPSGPERL